MTATIIQGDAIVEMGKLPEGSVDLVLCDPPFQKTQNRWDVIIPPSDMWPAIERVAKPAAAIVLFASQPFTSLLVTSKLEWFRYDWCWRKSNSTGHLNAKKMPLRQHEDILVFCRDTPPYNPQLFTKSVVRKAQRSVAAKGVYGEFEEGVFREIPDELGYPRSVLDFNTAYHDREAGLHPTQKSTSIMDYLVRTYSGPGDTVLDFACGSGTTGVAAVRAGRNFLGIELDPNYAAVARERIANDAGPLFAAA